MEESLSITVKPTRLRYSRCRPMMAGKQSNITRSEKRSARRNFISTKKPTQPIKQRVGCSDFPGRTGKSGSGTQRQKSKQRRQRNSAFKVPHYQPGSRLAQV